MLLSSQSIQGVDIPYRLFYDIEDNSTDSNNEDTVMVDRNQNIEMNAFFFTWFWYIFFSVSFVILIVCIIYSMVSSYI